MALGSGLAAQFGFVSETTYGTAVTVTKFVPLLNEAVAADYERIESEGIIAGARVLKTGQWASGINRVGGEVGLELFQQGMGTLFRHMFGSVTSSVTANIGTHTFSPGDLTGQSMTVQIGRPQVGGVVTPFTYAGAKVASWELGIAADAAVTLGLDLIAKSETTGTALASATYLTDAQKPFFAPAGGFVTMSISGSSVNVRELTIAGDNGLSDERLVVGSVYIDEPLEAARREYTGTATLEFSSTAQYQRFAQGGEYPIVVSMIASSSAGFSVTMNARFDSGVPAVDGPDIIVVDADYKCVATSMTNDATAISATLINSQTAGQI